MFPVWDMRQVSNASDNFVYAWLRLATGSTETSGGSFTVVDAKPTPSMPSVISHGPPRLVSNCRACLSLGPAQ